MHDFSLCTKVSYYLQICKCLACLVTIDFIKDTICFMAFSVNVENGSFKEHTVTLYYIFLLFDIEHGRLF